MRKIVLVLTLLGLLPVGVPAAEAILLTLESSTDLGVTWASPVGSPLQDGDLLDGNIAPFALQFAGTGAFNLSTTTGASSPQAGDLARLALSAINLRSSAATPAPNGLWLRITLEDSNLSPSTGQAQVSATVSGRLLGAGNTVSVQSWVKSGLVSVPVYFNEGTASEAPATTGPVGIFGFLTDTALVDLTAGENFSVLTQATIKFAGAAGSATVNVDTRVGEVSPTSSVPEPGSLLLFSSGVLGLAAVARRGNKKRSEAAS